MSEIKAMNELIDSLFTILDAETASGKDLAGSKIKKSHFEGLADNDIVIRRVSETPDGQIGRVKRCDARVALLCFKAIDKSKLAASEWPAAEDAAEVLARKLEGVIMRNPKLATASFPNGLTRAVKDTKIFNKEYGDMVDPKHGTFTFVRNILGVKYVYHDGQISLAY